MTHSADELRDITDMPRGGFDASRLDRLLQTDRPEYLDRDDTEKLKRQVVRSLEAVGKFSGNHQRYARIALKEVGEVTDPKIVELGAGHGALSSELLKRHPTAEITVTDIEPTSVAAIADGELGSHPRATVRQMDATAIDAPNAHFDLAVFALSFHHLPPALASRVFAEGTRVARKLLIIDLARPPAPLHLVRLATIFPLSPLVPVLHDGFISSLRAYSPSALRALAAHADPAIDIELHQSGLSLPPRPSDQIVVAKRRR